MKKVSCYISKKEVYPYEAKKGSELQRTLYEAILKEHPGFSKDCYISLEQLNLYRKYYIAGLIDQEKGEVDKLENEVIEAISTNKILSENIDFSEDETTTLGQRLADRIAVFGGSWTFIIIFFAFILSWMAINTWVLTGHQFDKYPFILLNLILSCLAAIQAPIIMMSQNRQDEKDRRRSEHDFKINLKAELEIKLLHDKLDHLMVNQNKRLLDIQEIQTDYLEDILKGIKKDMAPPKKEDKKAE
jgi:uncharacterized membrane protein